MTEPGKYVCAECGGEFDKGWTDDEAEAEYTATFADLPPDTDRALVCDDCFKRLMERYDDGRKNERTKNP